jgi:hypothetical protein
MRKLFVKAAKKHLDEEDIYEVLPSHKSQTLGDKLQAQWKNQRTIDISSLIKVVSEEST